TRGCAPRVPCPSRAWYLGMEDLALPKPTSHQGQPTADERQAGRLRHRRRRRKYRGRRDAAQCAIAARRVENLCLQMPVVAAARGVGSCSVHHERKDQILAHVDDDVSRDRKLCANCARRMRPIIGLAVIVVARILVYISAEAVRPERGSARREANQRKPPIKQTLHPQAPEPEDPITVTCDGESDLIVRSALLNCHHVVE